MTTDDPYGFEGTVRAGIALAILESLRDTDTPAETLDDELFPQSLPRRLGLSDVVRNQIERYAEARRRGAPVQAREFGDLIRLVARRPDAPAVLEAAGRGLALETLDGRSGLTRVGRRLAPAVIRRLLLLRAMRAAARALCPGARVSATRNPFALSVERCLPARAAGSDAGCRLVGAALDACVERYLPTGEGLRHARCEGRGDDACVWELVDQSD
ncbi:MAG: hypothetical protein ACE5HF_00520 [Gemmatimonadota bacterium]